jgi:predicted nucleic acid-binding protein
MLFADEAARTIDLLPDALATGECVVPAHWRFEVANQALMGCIRKRAQMNEIALFLTELDKLPIETDPASAKQAFFDTLMLAGNHRLTIYDAAYLEVARRRELALISFDTDLVAAASAEGIETIGA